MLIYVLHFVVLVELGLIVQDLQVAMEKGVSKHQVYIHDYTCPNRKQIYFEYLWVMWTFNSLIQKSHEKSVCVCVCEWRLFVLRSEDDAAQLQSVFPFDAFAPEAKLEPIAPAAWDAKRLRPLDGSMRYACNPWISSMQSCCLIYLFFANLCSVCSVCYVLLRS